MAKIRQQANPQLKKTGYFEKHHICPTALGGSDSKENKVLLTATEHLEAHRILYLHFKNLKETYPKEYLVSCRAYHAMLSYFDKNSQERKYFLTEEEYSEHRSLLSEMNSGENNPQFGKPIHENTRKALSEANRGKPTWNAGKTLRDNPELASLSHPCVWKGKNLPESTRLKIGEKVRNAARKGKKHWYNNGIVSIIVFDDEDIPEGFVLGRLPLSPESIDRMKKSLKGRKVWNTGTKGVMKPNSGSFKKKEGKADESNSNENKID